MYLTLWSDENTISSNIIHNNDYGVFLDVFCENNTISANTVKNNNIGGVFLTQGASNNEISGNTITNNLVYGIGLHTSTNDNNIYHNCFINTYNAFDGSLNNNWDNGTIGNYWGDYTGIDADNNGIGDTPYNISQSISFFVPGNQDHFPLMRCPFSSVQRIIPGYNLFVLFGLFSAVLYILYKKMEK
jgi:nitrous oxidase accessory protein